MPNLTRREWLASAAAVAAPSRPQNAILIFCDDLGYGDLSCYGGAIPTPNLDRMAREGMRFTNAISANPVCSPSRAALMTGRYPTQVGVPRVLFPYDAKGMPLEHRTVANNLKDKGYKTACVGKWHLGHNPEYLPTKRGFDSYLGIPYSNDMNPPVLLDGERTVEPVATQSTLTERYTQRAVDFIGQSAGSPFFLYFPHTFPHIPLYAGAKFRGKSPQGIYGDVLTEIDWSVGQVFDALRRTKADRNTLVLFTSDNGPWFQGSPGRLRGRKGSTLEGGVRVPFLAWQPSAIKGGQVNDGLVSLMDVNPTVSAWCGTQTSGPVDGVDLGSVFKGAEREAKRGEVLYFDGWNAQCIRRGDWKLHLSRFNNMVYNPAPEGGRVNLALARPELYNLKQDPDESYDVAAENPDLVKQLVARAEEMIKTFPAEVQQAWTETKARPATDPNAGALPQRKKVD